MADRKLVGGKTERTAGRIEKTKRVSREKSSDAVTPEKTENSEKTIIQINGF